MAFMFKTYNEDDSPVVVTPPPTATTVPNENVGELRTGATWLLAGSTALCLIAPPVGACGVVASLVILAFCPLADRMTDIMSNQIRGGRGWAGGCWFALICAGAVLVGLVALGGGLLTFAEMAGRL